MKHSEQINELAAALSSAQAKIGGAKKDSANPFFKSKYADLASVWDAFRQPFAENHLAMIQTVHSTNESVTVVTMLTHSSGQWISDELTLFPKDSTPQSFGSAITYGRRYGAQAMAGVCPEDDDGNDASFRGKAQDKMSIQKPSHMPQKDTKDKEAMISTAEDFKLVFLECDTLEKLSDAFTQAQSAIKAFSEKGMGNTEIMAVLGILAHAKDMRKAELLEAKK